MLRRTPMAKHGVGENNQLLDHYEPFVVDGEIKQYTLISVKHCGMRTFGPHKMNFMIGNPHVRASSYYFTSTSKKEDSEELSCHREGIEYYLPSVS